MFKHRISEIKHNIYIWKCQIQKTILYFYIYSRQSTEHLPQILKIYRATNTNYCGKISNMAQTLLEGKWRCLLPHPSLGTFPYKTCMSSKTASFSHPQAWCCNFQCAIWPLFPFHDRGLNSLHTTLEEAYTDYESCLQGCPCIFSVLEIKGA